VIELRPYQKDAINSIYNYFGQASGNPLIAMPTGTGKGIVIAKFLQQVIQSWPSQRIVCMTHVKELLSQNSEKLLQVWPGAPHGVFSAGLKRKDVGYPVIFAGVQSAVNQIDAFGHVDLLLIDEAHLLSPKDNTRYQIVINALKVRNPKLKVIGFTATPYRTGQGMLTQSGIFSDICYDITGMVAFNQLIADGYLCKVISKRTATQVDLSEVSVGNDGEYNKKQLEHVVDTNDNNYKMCKECLEYGYNRGSWLLFATGIAHAENLCKMLASFGIPAIAVHSKISDDARYSAISSFKSGQVRALVNNNVLTTGFDYPPIDFIGMMRPTTSTGLWVQMVGRGTRPSSGKDNCLVLDFAGNTVRLGPINDPIIPRAKGAGSPGTAPIRICDNCGVYCHASARTCEACGYVFPVNVALSPTASTQELLRSDAPVLEWYDVDRMIYTGKYSNVGKPPMLRVSYICGLESFDEYVLLEHPAPIVHKATKWWKTHMLGAKSAPPTVEEALKWTSRLRTPRRILVHVNKMNNGKNYPEIVQTEY
jgi:DNA repair protein RadD